MSRKKTAKVLNFKILVHGYRNKDFKSIDKALTVKKNLTFSKYFRKEVSYFGQHLWLQKLKKFSNKFSFLRILLLMFVNFFFFVIKIKFFFFFGLVAFEILNERLKFN